MPRETVVPVVWTSEGAGRYGGSTANFWNRTLQYDAAEVAVFSTPAFQHAPKSPKDTQLAAAGWPGSIFKRTLPRKLPTPPKQASAPAAWFEWLSERCSLIYSDYRYDGKILHIDLRKRQVHFFVLISYRTTPGAGIWTHELLRLRIRGTPLRPFDGTQGAEWPGPNDLQAPGQASDVLFALHPDGREQHAPDVWSSPLAEIVIAVGPAPHIYLQPTHLEEQRVWVEDDTGVVLSKDSRRPAQWQGYRGDESGRCTRVWLNRDKVIPVPRRAVGYAPGPTWDRRNKLVLYTCWKRFRKLTNWFQKEKLFDYDFSKSDELLKFHSFLLIEPLSDPWFETPTAAQFRERCVRAESLAYSHFRLPHTHGAAPVQRLADDDGEQASEDEDTDAEDEDEAEADESSRTSLAGFPPRCTLVWGRLDGVIGKVPDAALRITHVDAGGDATEVAVKDVATIAFPEPFAHIRDRPAARNLMRLLHAFHHLAYLEFGNKLGNPRSWEMLQDRHLLSAEECAYLKDAKRCGGKKTIHVMAWAVQIVSREMREGRFPPPVFNAIFADLMSLRGACGSLKFQIENPMPFGYTFAVNLLLYCWALSVGLFFAGFLSVYGSVAYALVVYIFFNLRLIGIQLSEPFGYEDRHLPVPEFLMHFYVDHRELLADSTLPIGDGDKPSPVDSTQPVDFCAALDATYDRVFMTNFKTSETNQQMIFAQERFGFPGITEEDRFKGAADPTVVVLGPSSSFAHKTK